MAFAPALLAAIPAWAGTAATIGSTVIAGVSAIQGANAQAAASSYNARLADRDAFVADQNRRVISEQTQLDVETSRRENRRTLASIRAQYGTSGLDMAGSPLDVLMDTATQQEIDVQNTEYEGRMRMRETDMQVMGSRESATLNRRSAKDARRSGVLSFLGEAAGGAGRVIALQRGS